MSRGWSDPAFASVTSTVARHAGLKIPEHRMEDLELSIRGEMAAAGCSSPSEYARLLEDGRLPLADLVSALTIGETYFFRDPAQFELIAHRVLPEVRARRGPTHAFRAWSAGCSSGEEPYSLAMLLDELEPDLPAHIIGTDISRPALAKARAGVYRPWSLRGEGARLAKHHLLPTPDGELCLPRRLRERVRFEYLNLAQDSFPSLATGLAGLDLIICRNVLLYFEPSVVTRVATRLFESLAVGGWLLTAAADPPLGALAPFELARGTLPGVYHRSLDSRKTGSPDRSSPAWRSDTAASTGALRFAAPTSARRTRAPLGTRRPGGSSSAPASSSSKGRTAPNVPTRAATPAVHAPPASASKPEAQTVALGEERLDQAAAGYFRGDYPCVLQLTAPLLDRPKAAALFVRSAINMGDLDLAERAARSVTGRLPLHPEFQVLLGMVLFERGREAEAITALRRALYLDRNLGVAHLVLGALLRRRGDATEARRAYQNALRVFRAAPPDAEIPLSDGQRADRLAELASAELSLLGAPESAGS